MRWVLSSMKVAVTKMMARLMTTLKTVTINTSLLVITPSTAIAVVRNLLSTWLVVLSCLATTAQAAIISYETRKTNQGVDRSDYLASWQRQTSTIYSRDLDHFNRLRAPGSYRH